MVRAGCLELGSLEENLFIRVRHRQFDWESGWNNVLQVGLYQKGPDLSEVGSTWVDNLNDMRSLRPFSMAEIHQLGGEDAFMPNAWHPTTLAGETHSRQTSIPWLLDTRMVIFRRDMLAKAGINEPGAFASPEAFHDTLLRLRAAGIQYPLAMATGGLSIHNMASWVWGRGGHFRSPDFRKISLVEPNARQGMVDFFRLHEFIDPASSGEGYTDTNKRYFQSSAAVLLSGQWVMQSIKNRAAFVNAEVLDNTGYAAPPGVPWIGATHLVIWRHSLHESEALQVINHLTSPAVLTNIYEDSGNIPARISVLNAPPFSVDPDYQLMVDIMKRGRGFRSARLWAGVEMRLNALSDQLWLDVFANPTLNLEAEIERRVGDLASRLEKTLLANW
jgi:multiple sugar transport system substrate-binding protein